MSYGIEALAAEVRQAFPVMHEVIMGADPPGDTPAEARLRGLPANVRMELQKLGFSLNSYTESQLRAAEMDCAVDCTLIDDDEELGQSEFERLNCMEFGSGGLLPGMRVMGAQAMGVSPILGNFTAMLAQERAQNLAPSCMQVAAAGKLTPR